VLNVPITYKSHGGMMEAPAPPPAGRSGRRWVVGPSSSPGPPNVTRLSDVARHVPLRCGPGPGPGPAGGIPGVPPRARAVAKGSGARRQAGCHASGRPGRCGPPCWLLGRNHDSGHGPRPRPRPSPESAQLLSLKPITQAVPLRLAVNLKHRPLAGQQTASRHRGGADSPRTQHAGPPLQGRPGARAGPCWS
jgi:hypothetical protein